MAQPIIEFNQVTKNFALQAHKTFKEFLPALFKGETTSHNFTALNNISFSINPGETVGIIGPNGSGKSTILKLIAGVMAPTFGTVKVCGKISPLIELGAGFHPELTGRENIYLNAAILGLTRSQIDHYYRDIVGFSELEQFIDQPVKHYSSGMYARLGFAIAIHVHPDILIVDEILAVGDSAFQEKCFRKMDQFKKSGVTIILVSHVLDVVQKFCSRVIYINHSQLAGDGLPDLICQQYSHPNS
jgi:ABC-2 type transport system ATP-binding protein